MKQHSSKLRQEAQQQTTEQQQAAQKQQGLQFASVEEMLRWDASQTMPPAGIEVRLKNSIGGEPKPQRSWWERFFSRPSQNP